MRFRFEIRKLLLGLPFNSFYLKRICNSTNQDISIGYAITSAAVVSTIFLPVHRVHPRPPNMEPIPLSTRVLDYVPQEMDHEELRKEVDELRKKIKDVACYYHTEPVDETTANVDKLLDMLSGADASDLVNCLYRSGIEMRRIFMRVYIAKVLWARVDPRGDAETTLLPVDVVRCYQALTNRNNGRLIKSRC